jgi:hypothetical protein
VKIFALFIFCICAYTANAQSFGVIHDKDGFVNVREKQNVNSPVTFKLYNDEIFSYDEENKSEWIRIYKQLDEDKSGSSTGYIHKSRILRLTDLKKTKKTTSSPDSSIAENDSIKITVKSKIFNFKNHKLSYSGDQLKAIDGKMFWGTDGTIPKKIISSVKININNIPIVVPINSFNNLYEPRLKTLKAYLSPNNTIYIEMDNSDGAGAYTVIWIIKNGKYLKKFLVSNA